MKKIGLVGGTGPESTVMYYKKLNRLCLHKIMNNNKTCYETTYCRDVVF
ncbi:MAG: hypothetical protein IKN54_00070 [Lachnospiraceae bacterium]|nr:hypothetical protein [Lachnospiraceae bacterium]